MKNKTVAALLAIFLGGIGIHKFYLGHIGWGILYIAFCWTWIPAIAGALEGVLFFIMSEEAFNKEYNK